MSMNKERVRATDVASAVVAGQASAHESTKPVGIYRAALWRVMPERQAEANELLEQLLQASGPAQILLEERLRELPRFLVWEDEALNLVTTVGCNDWEDKYLAGSAYTAAVVMGLKGAGAAANADTQASHAGWSEVGGANAPAYTGNRPTPSFSAASARAKATSAAVAFTFTSGGTVAGCFINNSGSATKDNTTGILYSAGDFSGGSKTVAATDVLNVSYSITLT